MKSPTKKEQTYLDPAWMRKTAELAMKRGTAIIFSKTGLVYGILPNSGGSINIFYEVDKDWQDAVLSVFPEGAMFPADATVYGGPNTAKMLRPYASIRLPEKDGKAWIDPVTKVLHVKGVGAVVKSATFEACDIPVAPPPAEIPELTYDESVTHDLGKLLVDVTRRDDNRPVLKRVATIEMYDCRWLAATDAKTAMAVKCETVPPGFEFDPALVPMFDIVGYRADTDKVTGAVVRAYALSNKTVLCERMTKAEVAKIAEVMVRELDNRGQILLKSAQAQKLMESVKELGICAQDKFGTLLKLSCRNTDVIVGAQVAAELDVRAEVGPDITMYFYSTVLEKLARLGGDIWTTVAGGPAVVENGNAAMVAMPAKLL